MGDYWWVGGLIGFVAISLTTYINFYRPRRERRKLEDPVEVYCMVPKISRYKLNWVIQDGRDHHLQTTITLPSHCECAIQFCFKPKTKFKIPRLQFGFGVDQGDLAPTVLRYLNQNIVSGPLRNSPVSTATMNTSIHGFLEIQGEMEHAKGAWFDHGYVVQTHGPGKFNAYFMMGPEALKHYFFEVLVEDNPSTVMQCSLYGHHFCNVKPCLNQDESSQISSRDQT